MKLYSFKNPNIKALNIPELLNIADYSGGTVLFVDGKYRIWKLEIIEEVEIETEPDSTPPATAERKL